MAYLCCPHCQLARINGVLCHETGCPNTHTRYDSESNTWIKQRECFTCGCTVDADDLCCEADVELEDDEFYEDEEYFSEDFDDEEDYDDDCD